MKKVNLLLCALWSLASFAQISLMQAPNLPELEISNRYHPRANAPAPSNAFYARDFANGIPASFTNQLFDSSGNLVTNGGWEFRGPNTNPSNSIGSRGGQSGSKTPLQSLTASNGFVIFDSDYLDDAGLTNNAGNGSTPARHIGVLKTDTIDCTGHPWVELKFNSSLRLLDSRCRLAISTNGGQSFPDTLDLYAELGANVALSRDAQSTLNLSTYIGNSAQVVLAFVFDGQGRGGYYWMIDDLELRDLPKNELRFTSAGAAAAHDIIYVSRGSNYPKQGHMELAYMKPMFFDSNLWNYGSRMQRNVEFKVEIYRNNLLDTVLKAPISASLAIGDTLKFTQLTTGAWEPQSSGLYTLVYTFSSDSISPLNAIRDSILLNVTAANMGFSQSTLGLDKMVNDNSFGTDILGHDAGAIGVQISINDDNSLSGYTFPFISGFEIGFSDQTVDGGDIMIELYDTSQFDLTNGFVGRPKLSEQFNLGPGTSGNVKRFMVSNASSSIGYCVAPGQYYAVVRLFSNAGFNPISLLNDWSIPSSNPNHSIFYNVDQQQYFTGIANSPSFTHPWFRVLLSLGSDVNCGIGLEDESPLLDLQVFPNPSTQSCNIKTPNGGHFVIQLLDSRGQLVLYRPIDLTGNKEYELDLTSIPPGAYLLQLESETTRATERIIVQ